MKIYLRSTARKEKAIEQFDSTTNHQAKAVPSFKNP